MKNKNDIIMNKIQNAMRTKLKARKIASSSTTQTDYCRNVIYNNMTPRYINA